MTEAGTQNVADRCADLAGIRRGFVPVPPCRQKYVSRGEDAVGHVFHPHVQIDGARGDGAVRHSGIFRAGTVPPWASVSPPRALIALSPSEPSWPVPDKMTPIASSARLEATESKNASIGVTMRGASDASCRNNRRPSRSSATAPAGITRT